MKATYTVQESRLYPGSWEVSRKLVDMEWCIQVYSVRWAAQHAANILTDLEVFVYPEGEK